MKALIVLFRSPYSDQDEYERQKKYLRSKSSSFQENLGNSGKEIEELLYGLDPEKPSKY